MFAHNTGTGIAVLAKHAGAHARCLFGGTEGLRLPCSLHQPLIQILAPLVSTSPSIVQQVSISEACSNTEPGFPGFALIVQPVSASLARPCRYSTLLRIPEMRIPVPCMLLVSLMSMPFDKVWLMDPLTCVCKTRDLCFYFCEDLRVWGFGPFLKIFCAFFPGFLFEGCCILPNKHHTKWWIRRSKAQDIDWEGYSFHNCVGCAMQRHTRQTYVITLQTLTRFNALKRQSIKRKWPPVQQVHSKLPVDGSDGALHTKDGPFGDDTVFTHH